MVKGFDIFADDPVELVIGEDEQVIQSIPPHATQKALANCIRPRRAKRNLTHLHPRSFCKSVELRLELVVVIPNNILGRDAMGGCFAQ